MRPQAFVKVVNSSVWNSNHIWFENKVKIEWTFSFRARIKNITWRHSIAVDANCTWDFRILQQIFLIDFSVHDFIGFGRLEIFATHRNPNKKSSRQTKMILLRRVTSTNGDWIKCCCRLVKTQTDNDDNEDGILVAKVHFLQFVQIASAAQLSRHNSVVFFFLLSLEQNASWNELSWNFSWKLMLKPSTSVCVRTFSSISLDYRLAFNTLSILHCHLFELQLRIDGIATDHLLSHPHVTTMMQMSHDQQTMTQSEIAWMQSW